MIYTESNEVVNKNILIFNLNKIGDFKSSCVKIVNNTYRGVIEDFVSD